MNTFKRKSLVAALAGVSVLGLAGTAQAVNVNPDGLGQVLLYPYYTVRETTDGAEFNSLLSVVNSTDSAKAVKVRFIEGRFSQEVLDFNLFLSPRDVWTAAVVPTASGAGVFTNDLSCSRPQIDTTVVPFRNAAYTGSNSDPLDSSLDRTREGYVEIIEMGDLRDVADTGIRAWAAAVTHVNGVPADCDFVRTKTPAVWNGASNEPVANQITRGSGGLFGSMTLVNPKAGLDIAYDPTALENWSNVHRWFDPGTINPHLGHVSPATSVVVNGTQTLFTYWGGTYSPQNVDAVTAVMMHDSIYNEFVLDGDANMRTDWVVTMPTKKYYYAKKAAPNPDNEWEPLYLYTSDLIAEGACEPITLAFNDREERMVQAGDLFSPPVSTQGDALCWESTVITFKNSNVFGSKNIANIASPPYNEGWVKLSFDAAHVLTSTGAPASRGIDIAATGTATNYNTTTFDGLPVIGFAAQVFTNTALDYNGGKVLANYGGRLNHKASRSITNAP